MGLKQVAFAYAFVGLGLLAGLAAGWFWERKRKCAIENLRADLQGAFNETHKLFAERAQQLERFHLVRSHRTASGIMNDRRNQWKTVAAFLQSARDAAPNDVFHAMMDKFADRFHSRLADLWKVSPQQLSAERSVEEIFYGHFIEPFGREVESIVADSGSWLDIQWLSQQLKTKQAPKLTARLHSAQGDIRMNLVPQGLRTQLPTTPRLTTLEARLNNEVLMTTHIRIVPQARRASVCGSAAGVALRLRSARRFSPLSTPLSRSPTADRSRVSAIADGLTHSSISD